MDRRMVDGSVWSNENFASLPPLGRLLQLGLINLADDQGRCKANPVFLRSQIFPYDSVEVEQIRVWLHQMVCNETIMLYQSGGKDYLQFCNWWEYQSLNFAKPSEYPPPDGWLDRIRFNGKGNITLTYNWYKSDGTLLDDTCDAQGKPLPFVEQLPRKNLGGRPAQQGKIAEKVPTFPSTFPDTFPDTFPPGKVINDYDQDQDQQKGREESNDAEAPAPPSSKEHPLIRAFHELHNRYPNKAQMAAIIEHDPPIADWVRAIRAWALAGHNPTNIQGMLDWAFEPSRFEKHSTSAVHDQRKTGYNDYTCDVPPPDEDKLPWRAEMTRAKLAKEHTP